MKCQNVSRRIQYTLLFSLVINLILPSFVFGANPAVVNLLTADNFAVLAGSAITGSGTVTGDLGISPGSAITGFPPGIVIGTQYIADATAVLAQTHLTTAYNASNAQTPVSTIPTELGGTTQLAGIYDSAAGTFGITGTLTLDALGDPSAVFIFRATSTLITAGASSIVLTNGAQACNIFWTVGSSATLGTNSIFKGNILALTSITATTGSNVEGRLLARNGAITMDDTIITRATCLIPPSGTLRVIKIVNNAGGGVGIPSNFNLYVKNSNVNVLGSPDTGTGGPGRLYTLNSGVYSISEDPNPSYTSTFTGDCSATGSLTLSGSENKICTITNTYIPPIVQSTSGPGGGGGSYTAPLITSPITTSGTVSPVVDPITSSSSGVLLRPRIHITKTPSRLTPFPYGGGDVTYTYIVTNPGKVAINVIDITDDKCSPMNYNSSSDINNNNLLDPNEDWTYKCRTHIGISTENTAIVTGKGNGYTVTAVAMANVIVLTPAFPKTGMYSEEKNIQVGNIILLIISIVLFSGGMIFIKRKV